MASDPFTVSRYRTFPSIGLQVVGLTGLAEMFGFRSSGFGFHGNQIKFKIGVIYPTLP